MGKAERFARFEELVEQGDAVQVVLMESWLDDDVKCESTHSDHGPCSVKVTHHVVDCSASCLICDVATEYVKRAKEANLECTACGKPCGDHIRLWPI